MSLLRNKIYRKQFNCFVLLYVCITNCLVLVCYSPDVEFCGYNQPHPSENKIQFRIQTKGMLLMLLCWSNVGVGPLVLENV